MDGAGAAISHHFPPLLYLGSSELGVLDDVQVPCPSYVPPASSRGDHFPSRHYYHHFSILQTFLPAISHHPRAWTVCCILILHHIIIILLSNPSFSIASTSFYSPFQHFSSLILLDFHVTLTKLQTINERYFSEDVPLGCVVSVED